MANQVARPPGLPEEHFSAAVVALLCLASHPFTFPGPTMQDGISASQLAQAIVAFIAPLLLQVSCLILEHVYYVTSRPAMSPHRRLLALTCVLTFAILEILFAALFGAARDGRLQNESTFFFIWKCILLLSITTLEVKWRRLFP